MGKGTHSDDALDGFEVGADTAPPEGAFQQAPNMDAAPPPASMHQGQAPVPELPKKRSRRRAAVPVPTLERAEVPEEETFDTVALRASARSSGGPMMPVLIVVGLVVLTCSGVGLAGAAVWFVGRADVAEPAPEAEPETPTRTGSRGEIPVEKGLRRGAPSSKPEPSRPEVPDPTEE